MNHAQIGMTPSAAPSWPDLQLVDDVRRALECVYDGADSDDAAALLDKLEDVGLRVTR